VITTTTAAASAGTEDFSNASRESIDHTVCTADGDLAACAHCRDAGPGVSSPAQSAGRAALELRRSRAFTGNRAASTIASPAAVACGGVGAARLVAAANVGRIPGTGPSDGKSASIAALPGVHADTCPAIGAVARVVDGSGDCSYQGGDDKNDLRVHIDEVKIVLDDVPSRLLC
jgi:hypothetical protein